MKNRQIILIVDDDTDDREIIRDAFMTSKSDNREYVFIETGDRLLDYLQEADENELPSLIMLDLNMPGKDGREALREIKKEDLLKTIPIVVFTTSSSQRDRDTSYSLGANCFVTKPDTFNKLVELTDSIGKLWLE